MPLSGFKEVRDNVFFQECRRSTVGYQQIQALMSIAAGHPMKRARLCFHENMESLVHEMLLVLHRDYESSPIRQDKEGFVTYVVVNGEAVVKLYSDNGELVDEIHLTSKGHEAGQTVLRLPASQYRQTKVLSEYFVFYEIAQGPFTDEMTKELVL